MSDKRKYKKGKVKTAKLSLQWVGPNKIKLKIERPGRYMRQCTGEWAELGGFIMGYMGSNDDGSDMDAIDSKAIKDPKT